MPWHLSLNRWFNDSPREAGQRHTASLPFPGLHAVPDAPHGVGLGTGTRNYVNAFTQLAQWPHMAINFIESRIGLQEKTYDLNQTMNSW